MELEISEEKTEININNLYKKSKLNYKYLSSVKIKLSNLNVSSTEYKNFNNQYNIALMSYEELQKDWFWLKNGPYLNHFFNTDNMQINNFLNNCYILDNIAKLYGIQSLKEKPNIAIK
jgi:hypothetical protein